MAIAVLGFSCRSYLTFRRPLVYCVHKVRHRSNVATVESPPEPVGVTKEEEPYWATSDGRGNGASKAPEWKKLNSKDLGIRTSMIAKPTRYVLNGLKKKVTPCKDRVNMDKFRPVALILNENAKARYEVYLVGGCVRDLILKRTPKDFDIITSAELKEVLRAFPRCEVVGKRFPICHVHVNDTIVEVSSFSTSGKRTGRKLDYILRRPPDCDDHDYIRWRNCLQRDFTINGLMFDPYTKIVYDYMGGMQDIKKAKVRTVIPANISFVEDCARILRGVRIAARLGFRFTKDIAHSVRELSCSVLRLDKGRILMEMNYMLAYGSAEASLRLLWKFGLLEILLPIQVWGFSPAVDEQHILFPKVFEDVIRDQTCFWVEHSDFLALLKLNLTQLSDTLDLWCNERVVLKSTGVLYPSAFAAA
ncbi:Poly(A) polymerase I [Vitis vinifera]|uniref:Poly(A) polymerase I n=1 Tax=Vitis vinifera TaxID=29760 RepID=A0A438H0E7_VITVI|nr:Poly(A) polymerase I [Vitis vinifera]